MNHPAPERDCSPDSEDCRWLTLLYMELQWGEISAVERLRGDGSSRRLYRLRGEGGTLIGVAGDHLAENAAFLGFSLAFHRAGLPVPRIHAASLCGRYYLEDDLGDETLYDRVLRSGPPQSMLDPISGLYRQAIDDLRRFQTEGHLVVDYSLCYQTEEFDRRAMEADSRYFLDMFVLGFARLEVDVTLFSRDSDLLIGICETAERNAFLYRDFQSRNIMVIEDDLRFIDYQSGRRGARHYDLASLLMDAKAGIPWDMKESFVQYYLDHAGIEDRDHFRYMYDAFAILRLMQALGAFGNLGSRQGKPGFLPSIPPALDTLVHLGSTAEIMARLPYLSTLFQRLRDAVPLHLCTDPAWTSPS